MRANHIVNLRISHYTESIHGGMVGAIVCFLGDGLIAVKPGRMDINTRTNEWNFCKSTNGHFADEGIVCTVKMYTHWGNHFQRFRPDLRHSKELNQ